MTTATPTPPALTLAATRQRSWSLRDRSAEPAWVTKDREAAKARAAARRASKPELITAKDKSYYVRNAQVLREKERLRYAAKKATRLLEAQGA